MAKTEFISQIAHDIRTPMNAIMGFTDITLNHVNEPDKVKYGLDRIKLSGNFLLELVNEVLDISKIENGQMKVKPKEINICELFDEFSPSLEQMKLRKDLDISCIKHDISYAELFADPLRIKQIYTNILSNAVKYTPNGGSVTLEIPYLKEHSRIAPETLTIEHYSKICSGMHLLIAEDNELNYEVISELLKMHNITCEHAADGSICVEMLKSAKKHTASLL